MNAILIDDEILALQGLQMELSRLGGVEISGTFQEPLEALEHLRHHRTDAIFLDIEMPGVNGLELFGHLTELAPDAQIIFVTAFREYAVEAFELHAADYLVKPVQTDRLIAALQRLTPKLKAVDRETLELRCFGHFSIYHDGADINVNWRTRKAEELIAFLVCNKGSFVSKEKIADALWPEMDGDKSMANLYLAYYYVRKQNMNGCVTLPIQSARGKMRIHMEHIKCDLMEFLGLFEELGAINHSNLMKAEKALAMYVQEPFEDSYYPWLVDYQQTWERMRTELERKVNAYRTKHVKNL